MVCVRCRCMWQVCAMCLWCGVVCVCVWNVTCCVCVGMVSVGMCVGRVVFMWGVVCACGVCGYVWGLCVYGCRCEVGMACIVCVYEACRVYACGRVSDPCSAVHTAGCCWAVFLGCNLEASTRPVNVSSVLRVTPNGTLVTIGCQEKKGGLGCGICLFLWYEFSHQRFHPTNVMSLNMKLGKSTR